jgi:hypothetical protein
LHERVAGDELHVCSCAIWLDEGDLWHGIEGDEMGLLVYNRYDNRF